MNIIVVEDDPILSGTITVFIDKLGYKLLGISDNSEEFLNIWKATSPDLAIVDIHIGGKLDGVEVAEVISQSDYPIPIIFITSLKDKETFERAKITRPFAFIQKPFNELTLQRSIELALFKYSENIWEVSPNLVIKKDMIVNKFFFIKIGHHLKKIHIENILYVHIQLKYAEITIQDGTLYEIKLSLKDILEKLPKSEFIRIHRSYIISLNYISDINLKKDEVYVQDKTLPISKTYKDDLLKRLNVF